MADILAFKRLAAAYKQNANTNTLSEKNTHMLGAENVLSQHNYIRTNKNSNRDSYSIHKIFYSTFPKNTRGIIVSAYMKVACTHILIFI